jgi:hypothetical protein
MMMAISARAAMLEEAKHIVTGDRNLQYGPPIFDFRRSADALTALGYRAPGGGALLPHDIAMIQIIVKMSRLVETPEKDDHWLDIAGYSACGWECVLDAAAP